MDRTHSIRWSPPARGAASLVVVMGLLLVLLLGATYAGRGMLLDQKASAAQYRGTQAFEAAEAGLEWTLAQLNGGQVDAQCRPSSEPADGSLRERALVLTDPSSATFAAVAAPGTVGTPACLRSSDGHWRCTCPASGDARPVGEVPAANQPGFRVELAGAIAHGSADAYPGVVQLRSYGCANSAGAGPLCAAGDAVAVVSEQAALLPALANLPVATLSAQGRVDATGAVLGLHNDQPSGLLVDAGSNIALGSAQMTLAPGDPAESGLVSNDPAQAPERGAARFAALFGVPATDYAQLPATVSVHCPPDCTETLRAALAQGARMLWVDNELAVSSLDIGSAASPVLIVVSGPVVFDGNVRCTGLLYGSAWQWQNAQSGSAWLRGAAVIAGDVRLQGTLDLAYDAQALATLHRLTGSFVRVPGSWTDTDS